MRSRTILKQVLYILVTLNILLLAKVSLAGTPCTMYGRLGTCTPAYLSEWSPSEEAAVAYDIASAAAAGVTLVVTSYDEWANGMVSYGVPVMRWRNRHGATTWPGCTSSECPGIYGNTITQERTWRCPNPMAPKGYEDLGNAPQAAGPAQCFSDGVSVSKKLEITPSLVIIPFDSRITNKRVLTQANLGLRLTENDRPVGRVSVSLISSRSAVDSLSIPLVVTDINGQASTVVSTRSQPGLSVVKSTNSDIETTKPGNINWLPARYEQQFLITCYVFAEEDYPAWKNSDLVDKVPNLDQNVKFKAGFLKDTKMQGTGKTSDGKYIAWVEKKQIFEYRSSPLTSTQVEPIKGTTAAVDPSIVPYGGTINIDLPSIGTRIAQDTGGRFKGGKYKIDVFMGYDRKACLTHGQRNANVNLISY